MIKLRSAYGIILCIAIALISLFLSKYINIGSVSIAIVLGLIIGNTINPGEIFQEGITYSEKHVLSFAIALLGINLDYKILAELGYTTLLIIIIAMAVTISSSIILGKIFKFDQKLAILLGIGNGVCGSSAIAATKQIIGANEEEVGLSIAIVNFLGTIGIFLLPFIGTVLLGFSEINSGILIGNTLAAVGQVIAAGFSVSEASGQTATIIKMVRILMISPVVFILILTFSRKFLKHGSGIKSNGIPLFIVGFILFSFIPGKLASEVKLNGKDLGEFARILAKLHSSNIIHGDFTPANLIIGKKISVIDFGLGFFSHKLEDKAVDVFTMRQALGKKDGGKFVKSYFLYGEKAVLERMEVVEKRARYQER